MPPALLIALAATEGGTRLLADQAQRWSGGALRLEGVQGRLLGRLELLGLQFRQPELALDLSRLELGWSPAALLSGRIEIDELRATRLRVRMLEPAAERAESRASPPGLPDLSLPLQLHLRDLSIMGIEVHTGDRPPLLIDRVALAATLRGSELTLEQFSLRAPDGSVLIAGQAGLAPPMLLSLDAEWNWRLPDQRDAGGRLNVRGDSRQLVIEHQGNEALAVALQARIRDLFGTPSWDLALSWPSLVVESGADPLTLGPGQLHSEGDLNAYRVQSRGSLHGAGLAPTQWSAQAGGNAASLRLASLQLTAGVAALTLEGVFEWSGDPAFDLTYAAAWQGLSAVDPELPQRLDGSGRLAGRLQGETLTLDDFTLGLRQLPARAELRGTVLLPGGGEPSFDGELSWSSLQWPLVGTEPTLASEAGSLRLRGSASSYSLQLIAGLTGRGLPAGDWRLSADGDGSSLKIGRLSADLLDGTLTGQGQVQWQPQPVGHLELQLSDLAPGALVPDWPAQARLAASLSAQLTGDRLQISQLDLEIPETGSRLTLSGEARLAPAIEDSEFAARIGWSALQWPLAGAAAELASTEGQLTLEGTPADYRFTLAAGLQGLQLPQGRWEAQGSGDTAGLVLERLHGSLLGGELQAAGPLRWQPAPGWDLRVTGSGLNPGLQFPDLPGSLALELTTQGDLDPDQTPQADLELVQLAGELLGRRLRITGKARLQGETLLLERLALAAGDNRLAAKGRLSAQQLALQWSLQAPDPGALLPGSAGSLRAEGRLEGSPDAPRLLASLAGERLALADTTLARLDAKVQAGLGVQDPLDLDVGLQGLGSGDEILLQRAALKARGNTASHRLELDFASPAERLQARLQGGLDPAALEWGGRLEALSVQSPTLGDWRLAQAAVLRLASTTFELGESCLIGEASKARVCTAAQWDQRTGGSLSTRVQELDLARLVPDISGVLSGDLAGRLGGDGALTGRGAFAVTPGWVRVQLEDGERRLEHGGGRLELTVGLAGLDGSLQLQALQQGRVEANLRLPAFNRLPLPEPQPLEGRVQASLPDLSGIQVWVPELSTTSGSLVADIALSGQLAQPVIQGFVELADGAADVPLAGLRLRQINLRAAGDPQRPDQLQIQGGLASGQGRVGLSGRLDIPSGALELELQGENLEVYNTPDARALLSPDLIMGWSDDQLKLRGKLLIPEAAITPKIAVSPGLLTEDPQSADLPSQIIAPSADVVVLGPGGEEMVRPLAKPPVRIDSRVEVRLGERVNVNAAGFVSRLAGAVTFVNRPAQTDLIPEADGRLLIQDGTFRAFGQDLDIEWGQLIFDKVPATEPDLDIRAVRWINDDPDVSAAGVHISGPARQPLLELFSRPQLDDSEIQSYLLTGRAPSSAETVLSIGTYLRPKLYVGYGINLLQRTQEFNSLYTVTPRYGVEANVGEADKALFLTITLER